MPREAHLGPLVPGITHMEEKVILATESSWCKERGTYAMPPKLRLAIGRIGGERNLPLYRHRERGYDSYSQYICWQDHTESDRAQPLSLEGHLMHLLFALSLQVTCEHHTHFHWEICVL